MDKKARDNRANQLNPNNKAYWSSRKGNAKKSSSKSSYESSRRSASYGGYSDGSYSDDVEFVSAPFISVITGRLPNGYAWVVCNHNGEFLYSTYFGSWTSLLSMAIAFDRKKDAKAAALEAIKKSLHGNKYYRIRCIKTK